MGDIMSFLKAKDVKNIEDSFFDLMKYAPGSKKEKQVFFRKKGLKIPKTDYETMWYELIDRYGRAKAGEAVIDYVLKSANQRLKNILENLIRGESIKIKEDETKLIKTLYHNNGNLRRIGELLIEYMEDKKFSSNEPDLAKKISNIKIDTDPAPLQIFLPNSIDVFISCGEREREMPIAIWLYNTLNKTKNVKLYWWKKSSPGSGDRKSFQDKLLEKASSSDALIGILHYRNPSEEEPVTFSMSSYDEICAAFRAGVPTLIFREKKVAITGMVLPSSEAISITKVSEIYERLPSFLKEAGERANKVKKSIKIEKEIETPIITYDMHKEKITYNLDVLNNYIELLKKNELSIKGISQILSRVRNEVHKIYRKKEVNRDVLKSIRKLNTVCYMIIQEKDNKGLNDSIFDILDLLVDINEDILKLVKKKHFKKLIEIYEEGIYSKDLIYTLYKMGYFKNIQKDIIEAIDNKNNELLSHLISKLDFNKLKGKTRFINDLWLKKDELDDIEDKQLINQIEYIITQSEISW